MFARNQHVYAGVAIDPPAEYLQESLLEMSKERRIVKEPTRDNLQQLQLPLDGSAVLSNVQACSFLLGLMIGFFIESSALSAHVLVLAMWGDDADPATVTFFSILWSCLTSVMPFVTLGFIRALASLIYLVSDHATDEHKNVIIWHIECRFGLGTLLGVCFASVLMDVLLDMTGHIIYSVGMLAGVVIFCFCFQICFGGKHRQETLFVSLLEKTQTKQVVLQPSPVQIENVDPSKMNCVEVKAGSLSIV
jgi:hypothetical protein